MKVPLLTIMMSLLFLGCSARKPPEGMFPVHASFEVVEETEVIRHFAITKTGDEPLPAARLKFYEPIEFEGIEYLAYKLPLDPELQIFKNSVGQKFTCNIVKLALMQEVREFNSGALTNVIPIN
jgi:hypothetical protein